MKQQQRQQRVLTAACSSSEDIRSQQVLLAAGGGVVEAGSADHPPAGGGVCYPSSRVAVCSDLHTIYVLSACGTVHGGFKLLEKHSQEVTRLSEWPAFPPDARCFAYA